MNIFKRKQKTAGFKGKVIKAYGVVNEYTKGLAKFRHKLFLVEQGRNRKVVIEESSPLVGVQNRYFEFDKTGAEKLRQALTDASNLL